MNSFFKAIGAYRKASSILLSKKFWWFLLFPLTLVILFYWGASSMLSHWATALENVIVNFLMQYAEGIPFLEKIVTGAGFLGSFAMKLVGLYLFISFGGYLIMIIMSPIYSWLSERAEAHLTGKEYPFSWRQFFNDVIRGVAISVKCSLLQLLMSIGCFILTFIPGVNLMVPILLFFITAYFYGFAFLDYAVERKQLVVKERVKYINNRFSSALGIGAVFAVALIIPGLSLLVCSFVSLLSVIASVIVLQEK